MCWDWIPSTVERRGALEIQWGLNSGRLEFNRAHHAAHEHRVGGERGAEREAEQREADLRRLRVALEEALQRGEDGGGHESARHDHLEFNPSGSGQVNSRTHEPIEPDEGFLRSCAPLNKDKPIKGVKGFNGRFEEGHFTSILELVQRKNKR